MRTAGEFEAASAMLSETRAAETLAKAATRAERQLGSGLQSSVKAAEPWWLHPAVSAAFRASVRGWKGWPEPEPLRKLVRRDILTQLQQHARRLRRKEASQRQQEDEEREAKEQEGKEQEDKEREQQVLYPPRHQERQSEASSSAGSLSACRSSNTNSLGSMLSSDSLELNAARLDRSSSSSTNLPTPASDDACLVSRSKRQRTRGASVDAEVCCTAMSPSALQADAAGAAQAQAQAASGLSRRAESSLSAPSSSHAEQDGAAGGGFREGSCSADDSILRRVLRRREQLSRQFESAEGDDARNTRLLEEVTSAWLNEIDDEEESSNEDASLSGSFSWLDELDVRS
ncbi:wd g-beta repeat-containing protein [Cyclospora cayetanensis]|uniref:Wd g-beta repeat-containing protein n=1 Tax=Cyclospora cayetanensis TaxID=88456 RepID=A0A1D3DA01_9EIME|nr:wd g-beta repeat-containing protein [Cyclospora cayetanensis]